MPVEIFIGRKPNLDITINDKMAEELHAVIEVKDNGEIWIRDLNSRFGMLINNKPAREAQLNLGDSLQIGFTKIDWESYLPQIEQKTVIINNTSGLLEELVFNPYTLLVLILAVMAIVGWLIASVLH